METIRDNGKIIACTVRASLRALNTAKLKGWRIAWAGEGRFGLVKVRS